MQTVAASAIEWVVIVFIAGLGLNVLIKIYSGTINISSLLSEIADPPSAGGQVLGPTPTPKASLSRFQMLLFTFVIAGLYLTLSLEAGELVEIPNQVLGLLGISGGSYVVSKGIQANKN